LPLLLTHWFFLPRCDRRERIRRSRRGERRVILTDEGDGDIWMFGVQPGGVARGGRERSQAFYEFKKNYRSVLFDIAIEFVDL